MKGRSLITGLAVLAAVVITTLSSCTRMPGKSVAVQSDDDMSTIEIDLDDDYDVVGKVTGIFVIETDGSVGDITILESPSEALSEEFIKVVRKQKWHPEWCKGRPVHTKHTLTLILTDFGDK